MLSDRELIGQPLFMILKFDGPLPDVIRYSDADCAAVYRGVATCVIF